MAERYKIYEKLGAGGVGAVFRAYDSELKRWVAIKRLLNTNEDTGDAEMAAELRREADALASLRNPNIVTIFDVATDAEGLFMVMELLEGEDLADVVARGPLHYDDFKELASQTLEGLLAAHQRHILHRDIKPENIKAERLPGGRFQAKIIDFGLARSGLRARKQTEDQEGTVMGSIYYMAPEQLTREPVDERTDLYSLGCVFYEALSGRKAFDGDSMGSVIDKHVNHDLIPLDVVAPHVPPWLGAWVLRLMAQRPDDRPASAQQAIEEFRAWEKMAAAPAMMPWMPYNYGQPMQGNYTQQLSGSDTVPLQNYYQAGQGTQEEPVYYAEALPEAQPVVEMGGYTSQLQRPKPITGRPPVGRHTAAMRTTGVHHYHHQEPEEEASSNGKRYALIGGGVLVVLLAGWFVFGRGKGGTAASSSIVGPSGPPPVSYQLPNERIFPPVSEDIVVHLVPDTGVLSARKGANGKPALADVNEAVVEWHDLSPLGNDNFLRAFQGSAAYGPKRAIWPAPNPGPVGAKPGHSMLDFHPRDGKPAALILTEAESQKDKFPFGSATTRGERGLTIAFVFQADANKLPTRILTLTSDEGDDALSVRIDAGKRVIVDYKNGNSSGTVASNNVDPTVPCVAAVTWQASTGKVELRVQDAPGKTYRDTGSPVAAPDVPMFRLQLGRAQDAAQQTAGSGDQYTGYLGDVILYASMLRNDQIQLLVSNALREFYIQGPPPPVKAPAPPKPTAPAPAKPAAVK